MPDPRPLPCPLHPDVEPRIIRSVRGGAMVTCSETACWCGPWCATEAEAIARWSEVVGAVSALRMATADGLELAALLAGERDHSNTLLAHSAILCGLLNPLVKPDQRVVWKARMRWETLNKAHRERRAAGEKEGA